MSEPELSVVMPCLNEEATLPACLQKARRFFNEHDVAGELVDADNGSTDRSRAIAVEEGARLVDVDVRGYGAALLGGILAAKGRYVIMANSDDT